MERRKSASAKPAQRSNRSPALPGQSYGTLVRAEAKRIGRQPASYILGEFLAPDNTPCPFSDFVAAAGGHGLGYLCEADLQASTPELLDPEIQSRMAALGGEHRLAAEQHADFLTGRRSAAASWLGRYERALSSRCS